MTDYVWDENKRLNNIQKHAIDFVDAVEVFDGNTVTVEDNRLDYGEQRYIVLGLMRGRIIVLVYAERNNSIRIISARKATRYEQLTYIQQFND